MRLPERATVRDRGVRVQKLQGGDCDEALPDRLLIRIADRPWFIEGRDLPLRVGHDSAILAREVDPGRCAEPEHASVLRDRVGTYPVNIRRKGSPGSQRVEVDVARVREPVDEIERPVGSPIVERRARNAERACGHVDYGVPRRGARGQRREPGDHLEGRARRVAVTDGLVHERMAVVCVQCGELRGADAAREHVVVVSGDGHHRQDLAVLWIDRDADRLRELVLVDALAELGIEELLQTVVDGQRNGVADGRPLERERLDLALSGVPLNLAPAVRPAKKLLVDVFYPGTSDVIVREIATVLKLRELLFGNRAGVADHRRVQRAVDIEANALRVDPDTGEELGALRHHEGDLARHRRLGDAHRLVRIANSLCADDIADRIAREIEERGEPLRELVFARACKVDWEHADRKSRDVARQDVPVAVDDPTALGGYRQPHDAVLLGQLVVIVPTDDLEVVEPRRERREDHDDSYPEGDEAPDRYKGPRRLSHQTPNAPCFSVARRRSRATGYIASASSPV